MDDAGNAAADVQVALTGSSAEPVITDAGGRYEIKITPNKEVEIVFFSLNYNEFRKKITAKAGETITLNPALVFKNTLVTVEKIEENRKQDIIYIQPKDYFQLAGPSNDISKLILAQGLGVQSSNELSSSYSVRGGSYDENLVYVNDVEIYRPLLARSGQQEGLSFPNPDMVSSMNFSSGGFEAKYGDKMSSVLDVQYRKPRQFGAGFSAGLLGGSVFAEDVSKNRFFSWQVGARYRNTQYVLKSLDTKGQYKPSFADIQTHFVFDVNEKLVIDVLGSYTNNKYLVQPTDQNTVFGTFQDALKFTVYFDGKDVSNYNTFFGSTSVTYKPKDSLTLKFITSAYRDYENESFTIQGQYYIDQLNNDFGSSNFGGVAYNRGVGTYLNNGRNQLNVTVLNIEHKGKFLKRHQQFLWGVRAQEEIINNKLSQWNYVDSAGYSIPQGNPNKIDVQDVIKSRDTIMSTRVMGYAEYVLDKQLKDTSTLTLTAGVRSNYWTFNNQNVISPRVTLAYLPNWKQDWVFRASYGYYYQPPFYREMRDLEGNVNHTIKAQQSIHYVLSADRNFRAYRRPFKFMGAIYYKQLNNLIPYDIDNVRIRYYGANSSQGYATGIDLRVNGEFIKNTESWISLSVMHTAEKVNGLGYYSYTDVFGNAFYPGISVTPKKDSVFHSKGYIPRPTDQLVTLNMFFQDQIPKLPDCKMSLNLIYGTGLPVTIVGKKFLMNDKLRFPAYRRVDIGFSYQLVKESKPLSNSNAFHFIKSAWVGVEVWNLLGVNNTVSYTWIKDVTGTQYAIPNYLTGRLLNVKLQMKF